MVLRKKKSSFFQLFSWSLAGFLAISAPAQAATPFTASSAASAAAAPTACDPEYMDALESRAWLEAQREITQNQNLIVKPDSVLEYTCFPRFLDPLAGANMFSESGQGGGQTLDNALSSVVGTTVASYLASNFSHSFMGGRKEEDFPEFGQNYTGSVSPGDYACDKMNDIWFIAKCANFGEEATQDGFYDFSWYTSNQPRSFPKNALACSEPTSRISSQMDIAFNNKASQYVLNPENPNSGTPYAQTEPLATHLDKILPVGIAPATKCAAPIRTGVVVHRNDTVYADAICPNPGCHYTENMSCCDSSGGNCTSSSEGFE